MQVLWLRYLTEINEQTEKVPQELLENPEINKAVVQLKESAFSKSELLGYEKFWDIVSTAKTTISSARNEGHRKGLAEGLEKGLAEGKTEGKAEGLQETARRLKTMGMTNEFIAQATGLSPEEINKL